MKKIFTNYLFFLIVSALALSANAQSEVMQNARLSIKAGDASSLIRFFDKMVELKTDDQEGAYSKNQAEFVLKNFFRKNNPVSFEYNHQGSSPGGAKYAIGTYKSSGCSYRVYMKLKLVNNQYLIDTLDFTKE